MKTAFVSTTLLSCTLWSCSQHITPSQLPSLVQNSVHSKFPQAKSIDWEKNDRHFEAEFEISGVEHTLLLDTTGRVLMQKQDITSAQLPQVVTVALKKDFMSYVIDDLEKVEKDGQAYYQVELENSNEDLKKVYASNGNLSDVAFWD